MTRCEIFTCVVYTLFYRNNILTKIILECFHIRKLGRGRDTKDDEEALEFDFSKAGNLQAFADHDLSTCTGLETAIKMPEDSIFTPKTGLLTAVHARFDIINFIVSGSTE